MKILLFKHVTQSQASVHNELCRILALNKITVRVGRRSTDRCLFTGEIESVRF